MDSGEEGSLDYFLLLLCINPRILYTIYSILPTQKQQQQQQNIYCTFIYRIQLHIIQIALLPMSVWTPLFLPCCVFGTNDPKTEKEKNEKGLRSIIVREQQQRVE